MSANQRAKIRRALRVRALLVREDDAQGLACTVVDISDAGARLEIVEVSEVPDKFTIVFTPKGTPSRKCRLVWRGNNDVGVAFEVKPKHEIPTRLLQSGASREDVVSAFGLQS